MIPWQPRIGDTVSVTMFMEVSKVEKDIVSKGILLNGYVRINDSDKVFVVNVPLVACEPFDPVKESEATIMDTSGD